MMRSICLKERLKRLQAKLSVEQQWRLQRLRHPARLGRLRRVAPLSRNWGLDRGTPIDRYYIEHFLKQHREAIHGVVLEVRDRRYTEMFGSDVQRTEVLDVVAANPDVTIVADLSAAYTIKPNMFDCFILTQTLQYIYDNRSAIFHVHRVLRGGGKVLATLPAVNRIDARHSDSDLWRYTPASARALFAEAFGSDHVLISSFGNILTAVGFLMGMAAEEFSSGEISSYDPEFPVLIAVRAMKT